MKPFKSVIFEININFPFSENQAHLDADILATPGCCSEVYEMRKSYVVQSNGKETERERERESFGAEFPIQTTMC